VRPLLGLFFAGLLDYIDKGCSHGFLHGLELLAELAELFEGHIHAHEGGSIAKIRKGTVAYKTGTIIYGQRKVIRSLAELELSSFGKRNNPPGDVGGDATTWLYISASADPVSTDEVAWQADRQWEYRAEGWDADLYSPA